MPISPNPACTQSESRDSLPRVEARRWVQDVGHNRESSSSVALKKQNSVSSLGSGVWASLQMLNVRDKTSMIMVPPLTLQSAIGSFYRIIACLFSAGEHGNVK